MVVAAAGLFHAPLLHGLAGLLIVDQPTDDYDCICISSWGYLPDGERCYDVAAELYRRRPSSRVLIVAPDPSRLEEIGVLPSFTALCRRELAARQVPQGAISVLHGEPCDDWATAAALGGWMREHPGRRVLLLSSQFHSGQMRRAVDDVLEPAAAARLCVRALRGRDCDDTNWWRCRCGYRAFAASSLLRLQPCPRGDAGNAANKSADRYERDFLHALAEETP